MSDPGNEHERLERSLAAADIEISGAEVHGLLCGLLCAGSSNAKNIWFAELFQQQESGDLLAEECRQVLSRLYDRTLEAISGPELGFSPLLPGDEKSLKLRATGVRDWSQGFLYGIGLAGAKSNSVLPQGAREAMEAFSELTRMDLEALGDSDDSEEAALVEVTEFLWVAAMTVYDEMVSTSGSLR